MPHSGRRADDMAELRTNAMRLRAQAADLKDRMNRLNADLQPEAARIRAERDAALAEAAKEYRDGDVPVEDRPLVKRVVDGDTTWRAVMTGEDEHPTAVAYRARMGEAFTEVVERIKLEDDEFAAELDDARRGTEPQDRP